jgi:hypothetical protein
MVQTRPRSSHLTKIGWRTSGSAAKSLTVNPSAGFMRGAASAGAKPPSRPGIGPAAISPASAAETRQARRDIGGPGFRQTSGKRVWNSVVEAAASDPTPGPAATIREEASPTGGRSSSFADRLTTLKAKAGYAVGALSCKFGLNFDGISLTFMKVKADGTLDP